MVGDTLSTDILGAHQADIASVWLNQSGQQALGKAYQPTYTISNISDLMSVLTI